MIFPVLKDLIKLKTIAGGSGVLQERANTRTHGDYTSLFQGLGVEFETVRPYVVGDDVRYIDWRVTARIGKPHVKTFRAECDRNVLVVVDANSYMRFGTRGTFKSIQAAKTAALLCWKSLQLQDRIGGLVFGDIQKGMQYFKPTKNDSSVLRMLKLLCATETSVHEAIPISVALNHTANMVTPQTLVFVVSDFSFDDLAVVEKALLALRKKCTVVLLPVVDPADKDIPSMGSIAFANFDQKVLINTNNAQARKNYQVAWQNYSKKLLQISKKIKAPLIWIETMIDPVKTLYSLSGKSSTWKT